MKPQDERVEAIFHTARRMPEEERRAYLDASCEKDAALRERVERLLANADADDFFEQRPPGLTRVAETRRVARDQEPDLLETPNARVGRYKLLQRLGEGGFGVVYMAEQSEPVKRRVALKIIKLGMDTRQVVARFEAERQALAMMEHPNIAKVLDAGATDSGRPYFVMELVRGIPITQYCDDNQLTTRDRLELFIAVCRAIQHAHQKGVIHRDIKPSNILVTLHDGVPVPKIIDFGIAKATQQELTARTVFTHFRQMIGTPPYMSPEQAEMSGLDIDTRSDLYSLGVLLYELLTGHTPLDESELLSCGYDEIRRRIREDEPMKPSTRFRTLHEAERTTVARHRRMDVARLGSELKGDLDWMVMKCLEKDRTRRYETANAVALDIQRYLANEPVRARPPSSIYRLRKFVRRNRVASAAAACVALVLVAGLGISTWSLRREYALRQRAVAAQREEWRARQEADRARLAESEQRELAEASARQALENESNARRLLYASDMNLAQQALGRNNVGWAADLLGKHAPDPGRTDLRGWEWRYLWQQCRSEALLALGQFPAGIHSLSVSRDGSVLAIGEYGTGGLSLWDLETKRSLPVELESQGFVLTAFSPLHDWLAFTVGTTGPDTYRDAVRVWDLNSARVIGELRLDGRCCGLAFCDDGDTLVVAQGLPNSVLIRWDVPKQTVLGTIDAAGLSGGSAGRTPLALAPSAGLAAHAAADGGLRVLDIHTGEEQWSSRASNEVVVSLAFSSDATLLASGAGYGETEVRLWDAANGEPLGTLTGHRGYITHLLFWPDRRTLASASSDQTIRLWDLTDPRNPQTIDVLRGHEQEVWRLALLNDQRTLVSGDKNGAVLLWDTGTHSDSRQSITLPIPVKRWRFTADGESIRVLDRQKHVSEWTGDQFQNMRSLVEVEDDLFRARFSDDARFLMTGSSNGVFALWDLDRSRQLCRFAVGSGPVAPGAVNSDGTRVWLVRFDRNILEEWDLTSRRAVWSSALPAATRFGVRSADGSWALVGGATGEFLVRDLVSGAERRPALGVHRPSDVAFLSDGSRFAVASYSGWAKLFATESLEEVGTFRGYLQGVHSVAFSMDGRRLVTGGSGLEALRLWDIATGQQLLTLDADGSLFDQVAFSSSDCLLGSSTAFGALHIWRAPGWNQIEPPGTAPRRFTSETRGGERQWVAGDRANNDKPDQP